MPNDEYPLSSIAPFEPLGMPSLGVWNESAGKWVTEREFWEYLLECLSTYFKSMAADGSYLMKTKDIEAIVGGITRNIGAESASCTHQHWNAKHNNAFTVVARYNGKSRYYDHILPERPPK